MLDLPIKFQNENSIGMPLRVLFSQLLLFASPPPLLSPQQPLVPRLLRSCRPQTCLMSLWLLPKRATMLNFMFITELKCAILNRLFGQEGNRV